MTKIDWNNHVWSETELIAVLSIRLIEMKMEPRCEDCGVGANRPNCANDMGGHCVRHNQENVEAFRETISLIENRSGLNKKWGWRQHYPIAEIHPINEENKALLNDLYDTVNAGRKHETRTMDNRYRHLADIGMVYYSAQYSKWCVTFTRRGEEYANKQFGE